MNQPFRFVLVALATVLLGGCVSGFQTTILNRGTADIVRIECEFPGGKRIAFRDVAPMRLKSFSSPRPRGAIRLAWEEQGTGKYGVTLPGDRLAQTLQSGDGILVLRIEDQPGPQVRVYGTPAKRFTQSLLEDRGDVFPAMRLGP